MMIGGDNNFTIIPGNNLRIYVSGKENDERE